VNEEAIEDIKEKIKNNNVNFSEHVDVVTVDDVVMSLVGYIQRSGFRRESIPPVQIHSAITVRNNNQILTAVGKTKPQVRTYKLFAQLMDVPAS
jgi:hypothetical protein